MIQKIDKITIYVDDRERAKNFWVKQMGFLIALEQRVGDVDWLEVTSGSLAASRLVLYDRAQMQRENPAQNTGCPSIIFSADAIQATHERMKKAGVRVGTLMKLPYGSMFSFEDAEGNEFLVRENGN